VGGFRSAGGVPAFAFAASLSLSLSPPVPFVAGAVGFAAGADVVGTAEADGCGVSGLACVAGGAGDAAVGGVIDAVLATGTGGWGWLALACGCCCCGCCCGGGGGFCC